MESSRVNKNNKCKLIKVKKCQVTETKSLEALFKLPTVSYHISGSILLNINI